jgi:hypoxanthine phosphoribosyltransferase
MKEKALSANVEYEVPTWNQIYDMLLSQTRKIQINDYKPEVIIGVARGGLVPARILSDLLEITQLGFLQIEFYQNINKSKDQPTLRQSLTVQVTGKKTLIVDDIADTGESLKLANVHIKNLGASEIKNATLYQKPKSTITPDFFEKQTLNWVVFPWDTKETLRRIIERQLGKRILNQEVAKLVKAGLPNHLAEKLLKDML